MITPFDQRTYHLTILPSYHLITPRPHHPSDGEADDSEQALKLESERFGIPELLFRPQDCGESGYQRIISTDEYQQIVTGFAIYGSHPRFTKILE